MFARPMSVFLLLAALAGCSGPDSETSASTSTTGETQPCTPGQQVACPCLGGADGVQVCRPDGAGYEPCQCASDSEGASGTTDGGTTADTSESPTTGAATGTSAGTAGTTADTSSTGTSGAPVSCPGGPLEIDLQQAMVFDNPPIADWPVTTSLTKVEFTDEGVHVEFSKLEGPDRWPDVIPPMWEGPLQYTLGMAECIDGQWYASAAIEYWYGLYASGGNVALDDQVAKNWYYDAGRWGPLAGRQPKTGETIGIFVVAGNARAVHENDPLQSPVMERSNVVLVPMPDVGGASHTF